jgi:hypothetical protein
LLSLFREKALRQKTLGAGDLHALLHSGETGTIS